MFFQPNQSHVDTHAYDRFDRMALKMYAVYMRSLALFICHLPCLKKSWQCAKKSNFHDKWKERQFWRQIKKHLSAISWAHFFASVMRIEKCFFCLNMNTNLVTSVDGVCMKCFASFTACQPVLLPCVKLSEICWASRTYPSFETVAVMGKDFVHEKDKYAGLILRRIRFQERLFNSPGLSYWLH